MRVSPIAWISGDLDDTAEPHEAASHVAQIETVGRGTQGGRDVYQWEVVPARRTKHEWLDPLARASQALALASDEDIDAIERSNAFDLWKSLLNEAAEDVLSRSAYFRQVLGLAIVAVRQRDLVDFAPVDLAAFRTVTNILHSPSVVEADTARAARTLSGLRPRLQLLSSADAASSHEVEDIIERLLENG